MICPNCGKETSPFAKFCEVCGAALPETDAPQEPVQTAAPQPTQVQPPVTETPPPAVQPVAQPMTYAAQADQFPEASRYQEYGMGDVVAQKKSHKKLIIAIVAILVVISLAVAGFFIWRMIKAGNVMSKIKEEPTAYLVGAYEDTAAAFASQDEVLNTLQQTKEQGTVRTKMDMGEQGTMTGLSSYDKNAKKLYYSAALTKDGKTVTEELYADLNKIVISSDGGEAPVSYYLELKDLRKNAATSFFGPQAPDGNGMKQEQYDNAMDVYEYIYNNLTREDENYFGLDSLGKALGKDIDECGKVEVTDGTTEVFGTNADAYVVTHTFKDTSVLNAVYLDVKNWAKEYVNINEQINESVMKAIDSIDPIQFTQNLGQTEYEVTIKHFLNKDKGTIMKAEITVSYQKQTLSLALLFGADPASSDKFGLEVNASGISQKLTVTRMSDASQAKYEIKCFGALLNGDIVYTRDKSTGDFTVTQDLKTNLGGSQTSIPETQILSGNLKSTADTVTLVMDVPTSGENKASVEYSISNKAEIKELSSDNDILKASKEELQKNLQAFSTALSPIASVNSITSSATTVPQKTNAAELDNAAKDLYACVVAGMVNSETPQAELFALDPQKLPSPTATTAERKEIARKLTIQDVIDYGGLDMVVNDSTIGNYSFDLQTQTIVSETSTDSICIPITLDTTLRELYG